MRKRLLGRSLLAAHVIHSHTHYVLESLSFVPDWEGKLLE